MTNKSSTVFSDGSEEVGEAQTDAQLAMVTSISTSARKRILLHMTHILLCVVKQKITAQIGSLYHKYSHKVKNY
jgi:hypothetical protein